MTDTYVQAVERANALYEESIKTKHQENHQLMMVCEEIIIELEKRASDQNK